MKTVLIVLALSLSAAWMAPRESFAAEPLSDSEENVAPFVFDGCTLFPEGTRKEPALWSDCCLQHDLRYWAGGSLRARSRADLALRDCVRDTGEWTIGDLMYLGVVLGRRSPVKLPGKQWGNAWGDHRGFQKLTPGEILLIERELLKSDIRSDIEIEFLQSLRDDLI